MLAVRKHEYDMTETLYPRHLKAELEKSLGSARVVNVVGPRQSGKTTLVRDFLNVGLFVTFDDEKVLAAMEADPGDGRVAQPFGFRPAHSVGAEDFQHIRWFRETGPGSVRTVIGIVLYLEHFRGSMNRL